MTRATGRKTTQHPPRTRLACRVASALPLLCAALATFPVRAQESARSLTIVPSVDTTISYTDNNRYSNGSGLVATVRPGLSLQSRYGRLRGTLSYSLDASLASGDSGSTSLNNYLDASFVAEPVENWAYVDLRASVSQQSLSAYGSQFSTQSTVDTDNRSEVATLSVSPYVRGSLGSLATYEVRLSAAATNTRDSKAADSSNTGASVSLGSARGTRLGWGLSAVRQRSDFRTGRATTTDRYSLSLNASPGFETSVGVRGGRESTNVADIDKRSYGNWGVSLGWRPTERTLFSFDTDRRYFGPSHRFVFQHRTPLTTWRFASSRDAATTSDLSGSGSGQALTVYQLVDFLLQSQFPDPIERDRQVREFLRQQGLAPNLTVGGGFTTSFVTLQRRQDLSWTYAGRRSSLTLLAFSTQTSSLDASAQQTSGSDIRQRGLTASVGYRLTPTASATLIASLLKTPTSGLQVGNTLRSVSLGGSEQLSRTATASLGARYSAFSSPTEPYREASVTASLGLRF